MQAPGFDPHGAPAPAPRQPVPWAKVRVGMLLTLLAGVGLYYLHLKRLESWQPEWDDTVFVAVRVILPQDASEDERAQVERLRELATASDDVGTLNALSEWFGREEARYRGEQTRQPVLLDLMGPFPWPGLPPPPPRAGEDLGFKARYDRTQAFLKFFEAIRAKHPNAHVNSVYVYFYRREEAPYLDKVHSVADRRSRSGFVFARLDEDGIESAVIDVAHELLHLFGASDKYEGKTCLHPTGFVEPLKSPRYPQTYAEVMAQGIPVEAGQKEGRLELFNQMRVGVETAYEIGWIDQARRDRYYAGDASAGPATWD